MQLNARTNIDLAFFSPREWKKAVLDSFLPVGFPHSVSHDYLAYQTYDSLQAFFSTITALLANRALLQGLGVGDASSSATFAMLLTILKDAMSRIATIVFANRFGLRIEPDAKRYRFLADLFNDTAFVLELCSPYLGSSGKVLALTTGEALRALCGVAAGASKAALSVHFARHDNLAELNAKEASQETAVGLVGLIVGTIVVKCVEDGRAVIGLMLVLVFIHLWMNYLGVRSVCMETLSRQRATILFAHFLKSGEILSPSEVASREHIIFWQPVVRNAQGQDVARIEFATSYAQALKPEAPRQEVAIVGGNAYAAFISTHVTGRLAHIKMVLLEGATPQDAITAWFNAMAIAWHVRPGTGFTADLCHCFSPEKAQTGGSTGAADGVQTRAEHRSGSISPEFWAMLSMKGWNLDSQALETGAPLRLRVTDAHNKDE